MDSRTDRPNFAIIESPLAHLCATPGQFFLAVPPTFDPYLPQVVFPFRMQGEFVGSFFGPAVVEAWARNGNLKIRGAYGKGFVLPAHGRHALVLATSPEGGGPLIPLLDSLVARECEVTVLCRPGALSERWLPPEVELHIEGDVLAAASNLWDWADSVYASGESDFYDHLLASISSRRLRLEPGWGQVLVHDLAMPCGIGVCYLCAFRTRSGLVLNCREGPVYDLANWVAEG